MYNGDLGTVVEVDAWRITVSTTETADSNLGNFLQWLSMCRLMGLCLLSEVAAQPPCCEEPNLPVLTRGIYGPPSRPASWNQSCQYVSRWADHDQIMVMLCVLCACMMRCRSSLRPALA